MNHLFLFIQSNLIWTHGKPVLLALLMLSIFALVAYRMLWLLIIPFFAFSLFFFRSPDRVCLPAQKNDAIIICPADGRIVAIDQIDQPPFFYKISIFLSLFDAHVNWLPASGTIESITYHPGKFCLAFLPKSSLENEHNDLLIRRADGQLVLVRQIAGTIARRICCWVDAGQSIKAGQKFGMIRFGSRVDLFLPKQVILAVYLGQPVLGGQTAIGSFI